MPILVLEEYVKFKLSFPLNSFLHQTQVEECLA
jgi:hypothetical protein